MSGDCLRNGVFSDVPSMGQTRLISTLRTKGPGKSLPALTDAATHKPERELAMLKRPNNPALLPREGLSEHDPIPIAAVHSLEAVAAENDCLDRIFGSGDGDWTKRSQSLLALPGGRMCDVITVEPKGRPAVNLYFDVSACFDREADGGKPPRPSAKRAPVRAARIPGR